MVSSCANLLFCSWVVVTIQAARDEFIWKTGECSSLKDFDHWCRNPLCGCVVGDCRRIWTSLMQFRCLISCLYPWKNGNTKSQKWKMKLFGISSQHFALEALVLWLCWPKKRKDKEDFGSTRVRALNSVKVVSIALTLLSTCQTESHSRIQLNLVCVVTIDLNFSVVHCLSPKPGFTVTWVPGCTYKSVMLWCLHSENGPRLSWCPAQTRSGLVKCAHSDQLEAEEEPAQFPGIPRRTGRRLISSLISLHTPQFPW